MKRLALCGGLLILFGVAACGGDDLKSVDRSKAMSEMTPEESRTICENVAATIDVQALQEGTCYLTGLLASAFDPSVDCESTAQECIASIGSQQPLSTCTLMSQAQIDALPACAATVNLGEFQDCQLAVANAAVEWAEQITCQAEGIPVDETQPAACEPVITKCPALLEDDSAAN